MEIEDYRSLIKVTDLRQMHLEDALWEIEKKPHMWLNKSDIFHLNSFINGWLVGRNSEADEQLMNHFDVFVVKRFDQGNSTLGWCSHIVSGEGEQDSLNSFYKVFREYVSQSHAAKK